MSEENKKNKIFSNLFSNIKKIKHLDIILTILFIAIILLVYFSAISSSKSSTTEKQDSNSITNIVEETNEEDVIASYTKETEDRLESLISKLKDCGNVSVKIGLSGQMEKVIAYSTQTTTNLDGSTIEIKSPVLITEDGSTTPIVLQTIMPEINSVVVVATGAKDTNVKLEIIRIIQALYNIQSSKIEVFAGN